MAPASQWASAHNANHPPTATAFVPHSEADGSRNERHPQTLPLRIVRRAAQRAPALLPPLRSGLRPSPRCRAPSAPSPFRSALRIASGCEAHHRGSTPSTRLPQTPLRRALRPLNRAPGVSPDPAEALSASSEPPVTSSTATPLHRSGTDCYRSFQFNSPQRSPTHCATFPPQTVPSVPFCYATAPVNAYVRASLRRFPTLRYTARACAHRLLWDRRNASSHRIPMLINSPMPLASLHTTGISQHGSRELAHNVALCRIPRRIPRGRRRRLMST